MVRLAALYSQYIAVVYKTALDRRLNKEPAAKVEAQGIFYPYHIASYVKLIVQPLTEEGHVGLGYHPAHTDLYHIV